MCGIGGFLIEDHKLIEPIKILKKMSGSLTKRGPDDEGFWNDEKAGIYLFHRRLSILDLSKNGKQPMFSNNKRYIISFNGEVYNFNKIARELTDLGVKFKSQSDTEVILESCSKWGVLKSVKKFIGMFAIAIWDRKENELHLIRDRLGIKPLYWGSSNNNFYFSSTLDAINQLPFSSKKISKASLSLYLKYGYIPSKYSIFEKIQKVKPGTILTITKNKKVKEENFWIFEKRISYNYLNKQFKCIKDGLEETESLIRDSIKLRMISDAPIGAFLSGGIDSSLVASIMQSNATRPIKTFSIGFNDKSYNEALHAKEIAHHIGSEHSELYLDDATLLEIVPKIHEYYDEPFFDSSSIPTFLLSQFASKQVKVALSGDGGDELFAGYNRYRLAKKISNFNSNTPKFFRFILNKLIKSIPQNTYDKYTFQIQKFFGLHAAGEKLYKLANCLLCINNDDLYDTIISHWQDLDVNNQNSENHLEKFILCILPNFIKNIEERMQYLDQNIYMEGDILTKVDRASMACSLEVRVPLIDHRLLENSWRLPLEFKLYQGNTKYVLKEILKKYVPEKLFSRPKMGFGVPLNKWLRNQLYDWARTIIYSTNWEDNFNLNNNLIINSWENFVKYGNPSATHMWIILSLGSWYKRF